MQEFIGQPIGPIGHVTVNERMPSQRFNRFVEEKVQGWLRDNSMDAAPVDFEVAFFDEEPLGEVSCLVVISSEGQMWRSWESADNPRLALRRTMENIRPDSDEVTQTAYAYHS